MRLIRLAASAILVLGLVTSASSELSTKEKIRIHREWLEKKAGYKFQNSTPKKSFFWRTIKPKNETNTNSTNNATVTSSLTNHTLPLERPLQSANVIHDILNKSTPSNHSTQPNHNQPLSNDVYPELDTQTIPTTATIDVTLPDVGYKTNKGVTEAAPTTPFIQSVTNTKPTITSTTKDIAQTRTTINPGVEANRTDMHDAETGSPVVATTAITDTIKANLTMTKPIKRPRIRKFPHWGPWSKWSECSRSCGTGVMFQQRKCIGRRASNPTKRVISRGCAGLFRRYRLCNEQECPVQVDFRQQQCTAYDEHLFQGKRYIWEPYIKDDAECELNCKPVGLNYFATLNSTVIDGTPCSRPAEYYRKNYRGRAVCVDGICKVRWGRVSLNAMKINILDVVGPSSLNSLLVMMSLGSDEIRDDDGFADDLALKTWSLR